MSVGGLELLRWGRLRVNENSGHGAAFQVNFCGLLKVFMFNREVPLRLGNKSSAVLFFSVISFLLLLDTPGPMVAVATKVDVPLRALQGSRIFPWDSNFFVNATLGRERVDRCHVTSSIVVGVGLPTGFRLVARISNGEVRARSCVVLLGGVGVSIRYLDVRPRRLPCFAV